jgi:hypothetical protein
MDTVAAWREFFPLAIGGDHVEQFKAAVGAGGIPLGSPAEFSRAFVRSVEPLTVKGQLTPRRVPFLISLSIASSPAGFAWASAGLPFPATSLTFDEGDPLEPLKAGGILALTREVVEMGARGTEQFVLDELGKSYRIWLDDAMLNPAYTAIAGERPASITAGASTTSSAGSSTADMVEDARRAIAGIAGQGGHLQSTVAIMAPETAIALRASGHQAFIGLTARGGDYCGLPALCSEAAGTQIVLLDQSEFYVADEGEADFDISEHASIEMDDAPTQDGSSGTGASLVSLWQANLRAIRVSRTVNWRVNGAVKVISGVSYAAAGSPA